MAHQPTDWREQVIATMEANALALPPAPMSTIPSPAPLSAGGHLQPHFDEIQLLPPAGQELLRRLRQRRADAHRLVPEFEQVREASLARIEAENALKRLSAHPQDGGFNLPPDDRRVIEAQRLLDKRTADFKRLQELATVRTASFQAMAGALANVETWLKGGRPGNTTLEAVDEIEAKLNKGESLTDGIERLRRRARELRADHHRVASAPFPSNYCKAQMASQIEELAQRGAPSVALLIEHGRKIEFQTQRVTSEVHGERRALGFAEIPDAVALFAWTFKDQVIAKLSAEIDSESDDAAALSAEARQKAEAEIAGDLLDIERQEATFVWSAQEQGLPIEHRSDINPVALLGVRLIIAPRAAAAETSMLWSSPLRR